VSKACLPHLKRGSNPHILTLSPPISLRPDWLGAQTGYAVAKYGMTLTALGLAAELGEAGVASNTLWPRTLVATAAVRNLLGGSGAIARARTPAVYADSAYLILTSPSRECTGNSFLCEDVLLAHGIADLTKYAVDPACQDFALDVFVDAVNPPGYLASA
jgi:citronellol/citronellal dehydrogenase